MTVAPDEESVVFALFHQEQRQFPEMPLAMVNADGKLGSELLNRVYHPGNNVRFGPFQVHLDQIDSRRPLGRNVAVHGDARKFHALAFRHLYINGAP